MLLLLLLLCLPGNDLINDSDPEAIPVPFSYERCMTIFSCLYRLASIVKVGCYIPVFNNRY